MYNEQNVIVQGSKSWYVLIENDSFIKEVDQNFNQGHSLKGSFLGSSFCYA